MGTIAPVTPVLRRKPPLGIYRYNLDKYDIKVISNGFRDDTLKRDGHRMSDQLEGHTDMKVEIVISI